MAAARARRPQVELSARASDLEAADQLKDRIVPPIYDRAEALTDALLDELRSRKRRAVTRGDLIAALIYDAPRDGKKPVKNLDRYEQAPVWRVLESKRKTGRVTLRPRKPGRPSR